MADIKDWTSVNLGVDAAYMWTVSDQFSAGAYAGYTTFLGKTVDEGPFEIKTDDVSFVPVGGTAQYSVADNVFIGLDLAYAINASGDNNDSGFLYQPKVGYQMDKFEFYLGYKGISVNDATAAALNVGFNYKF